MPASRQSTHAWPRAAATSVIWHAIAPARRVWMRVETAVARATGAVDSEASGSASTQEALTVSTVRSSRVFRTIDGALETAMAAWHGSITGAILRQASDGARTRTAAERLRIAGGVMIVASATSLLLQRLVPRPVPFAWIVPALFLFLGVCLVARVAGRPPR